MVRLACSSVPRDQPVAAFYSLLHGFELSPHSLDGNSGRLNQREVLGMLSQEWREHAWDKVAKLRGILIAARERVIDGLHWRY